MPLWPPAAVDRVVYAEPVSDAQLKAFEQSRLKAAE